MPLSFFFLLTCPCSSNAAITWPQRADGTSIYCRGRHRCMELLCRKQPLNHFNYTSLNKKTYCYSTQSGNLNFICSLASMYSLTLEAYTLTAKMLGVIRTVPSANHMITAKVSPVYAAKAAGTKNTSARKRRTDLRTLKP